MVATNEVRSSAGQKMTEKWWKLPSGYVKLLATIPPVTTDEASLKMLVVKWGRCLRWLLTMSSWQVAEKGLKCHQKSASRQQRSHPRRRLRLDSKSRPRQGEDIWVVGHIGGGVAGCDRCDTGARGRSRSIVGASWWSKGHHRRWWPKVAAATGGEKSSKNVGKIPYYRRGWC